MELSITYVQPLIEWLKAHPEWAAILVFLISFMESLAIIGSIVPGSVMMTVVGILAGTGVIDLKSSLVACILGAIAGDGGSYFLGYYFSERLAQVWPFSRYPSWLSYGKTYFERHGGKSVFLGRFVGPLRSLIPAIAGMMKMKHLHFFVANVSSAIGWSMLYLVPGVLVGAASATLSAETATRLFLVIIAVLLGIWLLGMGMKKLWSKIRETLSSYLHHLWLKAKKIKPLNPMVRALTPKDETQHAKTLSLLLLCIFLTTLSTLSLFNAFHDAICVNLDLPIYFFLQSIRTPAFDQFFVAALLLINPISIFVIVLSQIGYSIFTAHARLAQYWLSLCLFSFFLLLGFNHHLILHHSELLNIPQGKLMVPARHLGFATAALTFFMLTTLKSCSPLLKKTIKWTISLLIIFSSIALLYLGENWFSSALRALLTGFSLSLAHWLFYRRRPEKHLSMAWIVGLAFSLYFSASLAVLIFNFKQMLHEHQPKNAQYMLTYKAWSEQDKPILPMYSNNRLGRPDGLFNIQYLGSIQHLEETLSAHGWKKQSTSFVRNLIAKADKQKSKITLKGQFYLNRKPDLVMSYGKKGKSVLLLSLWRSNFHLLHRFHPLWIGTLQPYYRSKSQTFVTIPFNPLLHAVREFKIRTLEMTNTELPYYGSPVKVIMIEDEA